MKNYVRSIFNYKTYSIKWFLFCCCNNYRYHRCCLWYCANLAEGFSYDYEPPFLKKWIRNCTITCIASTLFNIFTPTTKDAMIIYGIGTTVDFLQENENVQQLPDKCVKALNDWVDSLVEDDGKE